MPYRCNCIVGILALTGGFAVRRSSTNSATPPGLTAERIAKACLLMPRGGGSRRLSVLADRSVTLAYRSYSLPVYLELAKGMAEYRDGRFQSAVEWLQKSPEYSPCAGNCPSSPTWPWLTIGWGRRRKPEGLDKARQLEEQVPKPGDAGSSNEGPTTGSSARSPIARRLRSWTCPTAAKRTRLFRNINGRTPPITSST